MTDPLAMKTNGVGQFCDWLNHDVSLADDPEFFSDIGGQDRKDGFVDPKREPVRWNGRRVSKRNTYLLWGAR